MWIISPRLLPTVFGQSSYDGKPSGNIVIFRAFSLLSTTKLVVQSCEKQYAMIFVSERLAYMHIDYGAMNPHNIVTYLGIVPT